MKIQVEAKKFAKGIGKMLTKGKFTVNGTDGYNVTEANIYALDKEIENIVLVGSDNPGSIYVRLVFGGKVLEPGSLFIPDLVELNDYVSGMDGEITIEYKDGITEIYNDRVHYKIVLMNESVIYEFDEWNSKAGEAIYDGHGFDQFITTYETSEISKLYDIAYKKIKTDTFYISPIDSEVFAISLKNESTNKSIEMKFAGDVFEDDADIIKIKYSLPILKNLDGLLAIHKLIRDEGASYYWFECLDSKNSHKIEWVVSNAE